MTVFDVFAEHTDGWEYLGNCPTDSVMLMADLYKTNTDTRLLFIDTKVVVFQKPTYMGKVKKLINFVLDNVERLEIQSMFKGYPDILIIPKQEVLNGFKLDLSGYSRTPTPA